MSSTTIKFAYIELVQPREQLGRLILITHVERVSRIYVDLDCFQHCRNLRGSEDSVGHDHIQLKLEHVWASAFYIVKAIVA